MATSSNEAISEIFVLSPNTVRTHIQNIIKKMGVHSKLQATTLALQLGIITMPRRTNYLKPNGSALFGFRRAALRKCAGRPWLIGWHNG